MPQVRNPLHRKHMNRRVNHELYREKMSFTHTWKRILELEEQLVTMAKPGVAYDQQGNILVVPADPSGPAVAAIKTVLDSNWKKINKLLPDAKEEELTAAVIEAMDADAAGKLMDPIEFKSRFMHWINSGKLLAPPKAVIPAEDQPGVDQPATDDEIPEFLR